MGKKRKSTQKPGRHDDRKPDVSTPVVRSPDKPSSPAPDPAFWFGFEVSWAKLALGRVVLFGLLAIDALLAIRHAPRYGAGGFNVAQLPGLDGLGPSRVSYEIAELTCAYLFVLAACGVATRRVIPIAAAIYAWLYFGSQLDSYQHHYLVVLVLLIASFVPWQRPAGVEAWTPIRTWAIRLILFQLAVMYVWAAISKLDAAWLDGRTLDTQIQSRPGDLIDLRGMIDATIGIRGMARIVIVTELVLACTVWIKRAWPFAAPLGLLFHLGIVLSGLEIGLFAWLMIGMYVLVVPDRIWIWAARVPPVQAVRALVQRASEPLAGPLRWAVFLGGIVVGLGLAIATRYEHALLVGILLALVSIALGLLGRGAGARVAWIGLANLLVFVTWLGVDRVSSVATDYYRFWGGSTRRLGDVATSEHAYRRLVEIAPDDPTGHFQLGRILLPTDAEAGLAELHDAERLEPRRARARLEEARWLSRQGRTVDAIAKAREALAAEPTHPDAKALVDSLTGNRARPIPKQHGDDDEPRDDSR